MPENYTNLNFYLGLRKLAGLRSLAPGIRYFDTDLNKEVIVVQKDKIIYLTGCEMAALMGDCVSIQYKQNYDDSYIVVKSLLLQNSFTVNNTLNGSDILRTNISGSPTMPYTKWQNPSYFSYKANIGAGMETIIEEFDTCQSMQVSMINTVWSQEVPIDVIFQNFSRSFSFKKTGYYEITLDESSSALYNQITAQYPITDPDTQGNPNLYATETRGPWIPVNYSTLEHGDILKRTIIVRCVDNLDLFDGLPISYTTQPISLNADGIILDKNHLKITSCKINSINYTNSNKKYFIDNTVLIDELTFESNDLNILNTSSTTYRNLRNRKYIEVVFEGGGDLIKQEYTGTEIKPVDMRNSEFRNCKFVNVTFGSKDCKQLILDGTGFYSCEFINCKFYLKSQNVLFKDCTFENFGFNSGVFKFNGSNGNHFIDLTMKGVTTPFLFDNSDNSNNLNNLFYRIFVYESSDLSSKNSFLKVTSSNDLVGTFTGNIILMNYVARAIGNPIDIDSTASMNLFTTNIFNSSGSIKLGKEDEEVDEFWAATWHKPKYNSKYLVPALQIEGRLSGSSSLDEGKGNDPSSKTTPEEAINFFKDNDISENKRVIIPYNLGSSFADSWWSLDAGYNAATCPTPGSACDKRKSLDLTYNILDACKNSAGLVVKEDLNHSKETSNPNAYGGSISYSSPWLKNTGARVKNWWSNWLTTFKNKGGTCKYFTADNESLNVCSYWSPYLRQDSNIAIGGGGREVLRHLTVISQDPRFTSSTEGNAPTFGNLQSQLKIGSGYSLTDFNYTDLSVVPTKFPGYLLWTKVIDRMSSYYFNDAFYDPITSLFPTAEVSNYYCFYLPENDSTSDMNGHLEVKDNVIGNSNAIECYGEIGQVGTAFKISDTDRSKLVYCGIPSGATKHPNAIGQTSWFSLQLTQQKIRAVKRNLGSSSNLNTNQTQVTEKLHVWFAPKSYYGATSAPAFGGASDNYHNNCWKENLYHILLNNPDLTLYWNGSGSTAADDEELHSIFAEVNDLTGGYINYTLDSTQQRIIYDSKYLITGAYTGKGEHLWRISVDRNLIDEIIVDGVSYSLFDALGNEISGIWLTTNTNTTKFSIMGYDPLRKTLEIQTTSNQVEFNIGIDITDFTNGDNYSSIATGHAEVVFYTEADGTVKYIAKDITKLYNLNYNLTPPAGLGKCKQIVVHYGQVTALRTDGTVVSWGKSNGVDTNLVSQTAAFQLQLTAKGRKIKKLAGGAEHCVALLDNGQVVVWGNNQQAQMSDPNTVLTPIGLIPRPDPTDPTTLLYITNGNPYVAWEYKQDASSKLDTLSSPTPCVPTPNPTLTYRSFRGNYVGCPLHECCLSFPNGSYDTPYVIGSTVYPGSEFTSKGSATGWAGKLNWAPDTGAPYDYQFSRATTGDSTSVNYSLGASWTKSTEHININNSATGVYKTVPNSVFGTSGNIYKDIAASRSATILLTDKGTIETWGWNFYYTVTGSGSQTSNGATGWSRVGSGIPGGATGGGWDFSDGYAPSKSRPYPDAPYGDNSSTMVKTIKTVANTVKGIGVGYYSHYVILSDGSLFGWDRNEWGQSLPRLNSDGTQGLPKGKFVQVDGGYHHAIALRDDGTVACWGENNDGECNVPENLTGVIWVAAGSRLSYALKSNGTLVAWGAISKLV